MISSQLNVCLGTPRNDENNTPKSNHFEQPQPAQRSSQRQPPKWSDEDEEEPKKTPKEDQRKSPSISSATEHETPKTTLQINGNMKERSPSPSFQSMNEDEADYKKIFKRLDPKNELQLGSRPTSPTPIRPRTRRGREEQDTQLPVAPLVGLDGLGDQTARSDHQQNPISSTSTITNTTENHSRRLLSTNRHDGDAEDN